MFYGLSDIPPSTFFDVSTESRTRGHQLKIKKKFNSLGARKFFYSKRVVNRWNQLDQESVLATSLNSFKHHLDRLRATKMDFFMD